MMRAFSIGLLFVALAASAPGAPAAEQCTVGGAAPGCAVPAPADPTKALAATASSRSAPIAAACDVRCPDDHSACRIRCPDGATARCQCDARAVPRAKCRCG